MASRVVFETIVHDEALYFTEERAVVVGPELIIYSGLPHDEIPSVKEDSHMSPIIRGVDIDYSVAELFRAVET